MMRSHNRLRTDHPIPYYHEHNGAASIKSHHSHLRGNVNAPYGRPNLRSRLQFSRNQERGLRGLYEHVVALEKNIDCVQSITDVYSYIYFDMTSDLPNVYIQFRFSSVFIRCVSISLC
jgi:hypothetical protein